MSAVPEVSGVELIVADLKMAMAMFAVLDQAAAVEGCEQVTITFSGHGGDTITIGYGEQAEPAILAIRPSSSDEVRR